MLFIAALASCGAPNCIQCNDIDGYPTGEICRDSYETTLDETSLTWKEYANAGIKLGCTASD